MANSFPLALAILHAELRDRLRDHFADRPSEHCPACAEAYQLAQEIARLVAMDAKGIPENELRALHGDR